jgi:hypothetical protein
MYANLVLYTEPKRPLINPRFDLFAWLDVRQEPDLLFPAKVVDRVSVMLPDRCKGVEKLSADMWQFIAWQTEEKGYAVCRTIDDDWLYWSILADKWTLLNMIKILS